MMWDMEQSDILYVVVESNGHDEYHYYYATLDEANKVAEADWRHLKRKRMKHCAVKVGAIFYEDMNPWLVDDEDIDKSWCYGMDYHIPEGAFDSEFDSEFDE